MLSISESLTDRNLPSRHLGAIAALILISVLSSLSGVSSEHTISNAWDGFLWGIANPVVRLDSLISMIAIGLLAAGVLYNSLITVAFVSSAVFGILLHLLQINLFGADIAIAITVIVLGGMLVVPQQRYGLVLGILGAIAGFFQGYTATPSLIGVVNLPSLTYILGTILTMYAVVSSAKEISKFFHKESIQTVLRWIPQFMGCAICGIGIVFLHSLIP